MNAMGDDELLGLTGLDPGAKMARLETMLMVEWLADGRPDWQDATWVGNVPAGPDPKGIVAVQVWQEQVGACHVTTGNPQPLTMPHHGQVGVYIRNDVLEDSANFLRTYLARES